jgi:poly [ADP-ribose] polymerase
MKDQVFLMLVDAKDGGTQSNKFYNMTNSGSQILVEYGRVGKAPRKMSYPIGKWHSLYNSKVRKGYKDITDLKETTTVVAKASGNSAFDEFYDIFRKYTGDVVRKNYSVDTCTPAQIAQAQTIIDQITTQSTIDEINESLKELYVTIPRAMKNVRDFLITDIKDKNQFVTTEQDALDSMDSSVTMNVSNPFDSIGVGFDLVKNTKFIDDLILPTMPTDRWSKYNIHKCYEINHPITTPAFDKQVRNANDKRTKLLIHGTRNANIFSILKKGLMIRPTNAAMISGAAYGNGVYHSAHSEKSLGYTGRDNDALFLIQNVHMGKHYTYNGWRSHSRDEFDLNKTELFKRGYDSVYVKPGNGLRNSEYIVYTEPQTTTSFLVWMKQ